MPDQPRRGDAFGAVLLACLEADAAPGRVHEFVERDDGFIDAGDAARYFLGPDQWGPLDRWLCDRARGRVLDVGCGAGRAVLHLQERGLDAVGLDVSPLAIEVCRRRGVRKTFVGTVGQLAKSRPPPFDSFMLLGNNLGLLGGRAGAKRLLGALAAVAAPGAAILGQGMDPYATNAPGHRAYHERNRQRGRMGGQIRMRIRHRALATAWFDYLFATVDELRDLLEATGWRLEHVEPSDGAAYGAVIRRRG